MDIVLWIVAGLLAVAFLAAGGMKLAKGKAVGADPRMAWSEDFSDQSIRLIGLLEVLGAIGLILPPLLDVVPVLAPLAACGLALVMVGAAFTHVRRNEMQALAPVVVLGLLALFVAVGRFAIEPF